MQILQQTLLSQPGILPAAALNVRKVRVPSRCNRRPVRLETSSIGLVQPRLMDSPQPLGSRSCLSLRHHLRSLFPPSAWLSFLPLACSHERFSDRTARPLLPVSEKHSNLQGRELWLPQEALPSPRPRSSRGGRDCVARSSTSAGACVTRNDAKDSAHRKKVPRR